MTSSLEGTSVVDFSRVLAGPLVTMMLGDLGADVLKIEQPICGDETRSWGPPFDERGAATYFESVNRNKRSVAIDLADPDGAAQARALAASADVLVENFRPGLMEDFGLGHTDLEALNPGLVYCSITGFGRDGGAQLPGYDLLVQAVGGLMSITGEPDGPPQKVGVALVDVICGLFAATGILAALRHRDVTGLGQRVEVNLMSALLAALVNQASAYSLAGVIPERMGNGHPSIAPYELYQTGGGDLVLAVGNDRQFAKLASILGASELASDERFISNQARVRHRSELKRELERLLAVRHAASWAVEMAGEKIPAGTVNDIAGAFAFAEQLGLDPVIDLERADGTTTRTTASPIKLSRTPVRYRLAPPPLPPGGPER